MYEHKIAFPLLANAERQNVLKVLTVVPLTLRQVAQGGQILQLDSIKVKLFMMDVMKTNMTTLGKFARPFERNVFPFSLSRIKGSSESNISDFGKPLCREVPTEALW